MTTTYPNYPNTISRVTASMDVLRRIAPATGRLSMAALFLMSGFGKVADPAATKAFIAAANLPFPDIGYVLAVIVEIGGGALLAVGYRARIAAVALAVFTIVAAVAFHRDFADQNQVIHFLKNLAIAGGLLQVAAFGAGAYSLDLRK